MYYSAQTTAGHYSAQTTAGRRWPPLPSHFILAKVMPMTTPAARAAAAMASTPEEGSMDGDLGQEESHAHLVRKGRGIGDVGLARVPSCSWAHKQPRASGWAVGVRMGHGAREVDHAATLARGASARAVVALARRAARAPCAGLGGALGTSAAALAGGAATVAVGASASRSAGARHDLGVSLNGDDDGRRVDGKRTQHGGCVGRMQLGGVSQ